ncbi:MAG: hypothetical protein ABI481_09115 [Pyrinomonadaceae bacterium]
MENISATESRAGVMLKGKWYTQVELDSWLDEIAPKIAGSIKNEEPRSAAGNSTKN